MGLDFSKYGKTKPSSEEENEVKGSGAIDYSNYPVRYEIDEDQRLQGEIQDQSDLDTLPQATSKEASDSKPLESLLYELNQMIGLRRVKVEIERLIHYARVQELRKNRGITTSQTAMHSVFYGSPGTGKTTIARLYGQMLKSLGLLSKGHLVETDRAGLVAGYIGQTTEKTDAKINEALGGILFIDEAYSLVKDDSARWDYGNEVLEILLKRMEDHRDDFVVIVAGYPKLMEKFINSNPGLKSRFPTYIHFDDYTPDELLAIFNLFCKKENYRIDEEAIPLVLASIENQYAMRGSNFGNARYVRNLFEVIIRNQAHRLGITKDKPTDDELCFIIPEDVPFIIEDNIIDKNDEE